MNHDNNTSIGSRMGYGGLIGGEQVRSENCSFCAAFGSNKVPKT